MAETMIRFDPFAELADLRGRFERAFEGGRGWTPAIDVERRNGDLVVRADVPGIKPEEVEIEVAEGVLTVRGAHEESTEEKDRDYVRRERRYGSFSRSMTLPQGVDASAIKATTHDGVLEVTIPLPAGEGKAVTITPTPS
ncbi:MAG TPA: Hsp20/alpha crystallin family protein [Solirubrobacteraceae bacterium]|jgi:HSP20 family protein|nr:Hsp20/alpha crystallin family protein [Solirubrobacteraceae bacterium]